MYFIHCFNLTNLLHDFNNLSIPSFNLTIHNDAEGDEGVERLEDDGRLEHAVVVQLAQVLDSAHTPLVVLGVIHLQVVCIEAYHTHMVTILITFYFFISIVCNAFKMHF